MTTAFPYGTSEQFLEEEVQYWAEDIRFKVGIYPAKISEIERKIPKNIIILKSRKKGLNLFSFFLLIFQSFFWREIYYLIKSKKISIKNLLRAIKYGGLIYQSYINLKYQKYNPEVYYSYWADYYSYGALLLKEERNIKVITRMHGYDLYEHLYLKNYVPYKRYFLKKYDRVFLLSENAKKYVLENYGLNPKKIKINPLGVKVSDEILHYKTVDKLIILNILSISNIIKLKRIDKIIDTLSKFSLENRNLTINWHHYGSGECENIIKDYAKKKLIYNNIHYIFKGAVDNTVLLNKIKNTNYDLIINSSESEGVPVSLMEAMARGIIPIAPDIGGISSLVNNLNGYLISKEAKVEEIYYALRKYIYLDKVEKMNKKKLAIEKVKNCYNSELNYRNLIDDIYLL